MQILNEPFRLVFSSTGGLDHTQMLVKSSQTVELYHDFNHMSIGRMPYNLSNLLLNSVCRPL